MMLFMLPELSKTSMTLGVAEVETNSGKLEMAAVAVATERMLVMLATRIARMLMRAFMTLTPPLLACLFIA